MSRRYRECPECNGDGHFIEFYGPGYESGYAFVPFEREIPCEKCDGRGILEFDWTPVEDELPEVGERVMVLGFDDGAPDRGEPFMTEDVLVSDAGLPVWEKCIEVREWAAL